MDKKETGAIIFSEGSIPIEIIQEPLSIGAIAIQNLPFLVTALIVICAATVTYRSNRKSVEAQNEVAINARIDEHENKISEFRHHWIQQVRETASDLCKILHQLQYQAMVRNLNRDNEAEASKRGDDESEAVFNKAASKAYGKLISSREEYYRVSSKLKLLFKKDEPSMKAAFGIVSEIQEDIFDLDKTHIEEKMIEDLVSELQVVLKEEWKVTKKRSWSESQAFNEQRKTDA